MPDIHSLPEASADALQHSQKLIACIREAIDANHGSLSFRRYMEMALYQPSLGYYVSGTHKIGEGGDFITAPEVSKLFSQCVALQCQQVLENIRAENKSTQPADILELGAGTGAMAVDILLLLQQQNCLPEHYFILDLSPDLKQRQKQRLQQQAPQLLERVKWLEQLPEKFTGIIIGNEVLDAMPVDLFTQQNDTIFEHHVIWEEQQLRQQLQPAKPALTQKVQALNIPHPATPYTSEVNPNLPAWFESLSQCLQTGVVLLADYGYTRKEYYFSERKQGTLICHYQQRVNDDPLYYPGLQDITASVDFTAVAEAADDAGLSIAGFTSQATFLSNSGLEKLFMQALDENPDDQYRLAQQVRTLSLPAEMGERFKFIAMRKNYAGMLQGFSEMDQKHRL